MLFGRVEIMNFLFYALEGLEYKENLICYAKLIKPIIILPLTHSHLWNIGPLLCS